MRQNYLRPHTPVLEYARCHLHESQAEYESALAGMHLVQFRCRTVKCANAIMSIAVLRPGLQIASDSSVDQWELVCVRSLHMPHKPKKHLMSVPLSKPANAETPCDCWKKARNSAPPALQMPGCLPQERASRLHSMKKPVFYRVAPPQKPKVQDEPQLQPEITASQRQVGNRRWRAVLSVCHHQLRRLPVLVAAQQQPTARNEKMSDVRACQAPRDQQVPTHAAWSSKNPSCCATSQHTSDLRM